jgi:hypothetical protein
MAVADRMRHTSANAARTFLMANPSSSKMAFLPDYGFPTPIVLLEKVARSIQTPGVDVQI